MSFVSQEYQVPGVYVMQSVAKPKSSGSHPEKAGCYVVQAMTTANAIAGTTELTRDRKRKRESSGLCKQSLPGIYVVESMAPSCSTFWELTKELNNAAASSQHQANTRQSEEKIQRRRAKHKCTSAVVNGPRSVDRIT